MSSVLAFALVLAAQAPQAPPAALRPVAEEAPSGGLIITNTMTVRATVADRCKVGTAVVVCEGASSIRPVTVTRAARMEITF
jgi:hypothetical protein